jgi:hypothetical protein
MTFLLDIMDPIFTEFQPFDLPIAYFDRYQNLEINEVNHLTCLLLVYIGYQNIWYPSVPVSKVL